MKTFDTITKDILDSLHIRTPVLLGQGSESQVYSYTEDAVVRIYKSKVSIEYLNELNRTYTFLSSHNLSFDIPRLYEIRNKDGIIFQIEIGAVMFLDLYKFVSPQDRAYITSQAIYKYGEDILTYLRIL